MSDCFDHCFDAFDRAIDGDEYRGSAGSSFENSTDPLFYHIELTDCVLLGSTDKAYRIQDERGLVYWLPKSICRKVDFNKGTLWVHESTLNKIFAKVESM